MHPGSGGLRRARKLHARESADAIASEHDERPMRSVVHPPLRDLATVRDTPTTLRGRSFARPSRSGRSALPAISLSGLSSTRDAGASSLVSNLEEVRDAAIQVVPLGDTR